MAGVASAALVVAGVGQLGVGVVDTGPPGVRPEEPAGVSVVETGAGPPSIETGAGPLLSVAVSVVAALGAVEFMLLYTELTVLVLVPTVSDCELAAFVAELDVV